MNNLLFTALLIALLYYFFYYLPSQKKLNAQPLPLQHNQETQTETITEPSAKLDPEAIKKLELEKAELVKDIQQKERTITGLNNSYNKLETKTKTEIDKLKEQLKDKDAKLKELSEVEKNVDDLTKQIQDFQKELD